MLSAYLNWDGKEYVANAGKSSGTITRVNTEAAANGAMFISCKIDNDSCPVCFDVLHKHKGMVKDRTKLFILRCFGYV